VISDHLPARGRPFRALLAELQIVDHDKVEPTLASSGGRGARHEGPAIAERRCLVKHGGAALRGRSPTAKAARSISAWLNWPAPHAARKARQPCSARIRVTSCSPLISSEEKSRRGPPLTVRSWPSSPGLGAMGSGAAAKGDVGRQRPSFPIEGATSQHDQVGLVEARRGKRSRAARAGRHAGQLAVSAHAQPRPSPNRPGQQLVETARKPPADVAPTGQVVQLALDGPRSDRAARLVWLGRVGLSRGASFATGDQPGAGSQGRGMACPVAGGVEPHAPKRPSCRPGRPRRQRPSGPHPTSA